MTDKPITNASTKVITGEVRLSYAHLFEPRPGMNPGDAPKYSTSILIAKSDKETLRKIKAAIDAATAAGLPLWGGKVPPNLRNPVRDGDTERPDDPAYQGHYFMNLTSKNKPGIVDRRLQPITDSSEIYSGCYARVSMNFFPYSHSGNRGVSAGLNNVQKLRDGDYLGGRSRAEDDFDAVDFSDDDDDIFG